MMLGVGRKIIRVGIILSLIIVISACSKEGGAESQPSASVNPTSMLSPSPLPTILSTPITQAGDNDYTLTEKDMSIGDVAIGQSEEEVEQKIGQPSEETITHGNGSPLWIYEKRGSI